MDLTKLLSHLYLVDQAWRTSHLVLDDSLDMNVKDVHDEKDEAGHVAAVEVAVEVDNCHTHDSPARVDQGWDLVLVASL